MISSPQSIQPTFIPDLPGVYVVQLIVNDGTVNSTPAIVTITANLLSPRFAYVANGDNSVSMYIVDATTGQLRHNGYVAAGANPLSVTVDPFSRFAYVANANSNNISGYTISASSGTLTPIPGSPFAAATNPASGTVDPTGRFIYVANEGSGNISGYTISASSGALAPISGSPFAAGTFPVSVAVDPSGRFVYVTNGISDDVSVYMISATTGALTAVGTVRARGGPTSIALTSGTSPVTITPRFAYVANRASNNISGYTISASSGTLTPIPGSPFAATGTVPASVTVEPSGRFAYVTNQNSNNISGYTISASSGALTPIGSPVATGTVPASVT